VACLDGEDRVAHVRADRWIGYTRATAALKKLEDLSSWPEKQRMPDLLIVGPTNNGKSMLVEKFRRSNPASPPEEGWQVPVLVVGMPPEPAMSRFYSAVLAAIGDPPAQARPQVAGLERSTVLALNMANVRVLILDELHNILAASNKVRREFLNLLRFLGNECRIPLVGVGTGDAYLAIRSDDQLENRFEPFILPRWRPDEDARSLLASFAASFPLRRASPISTPEMAEYLLNRCEGTIGELAHLLTDAAIAAIESGEEAINQTSLEQAAYLGPTERRRTFERALT
jgi:hypothetical protein